MKFLDGQIFFALLASLVLAWIAGWWVARRYTDKVLELMQSGLEPTDPPSTPNDPDPDQTKDLAKNTAISNLTEQNRLAFWRLRGVFVLISVVLAGSIALVAQSTYIETGFGWRRFGVLSLIYLWPCIPSIGLLERWSRFKILVFSFGFILFAAIVMILNSNENQKVGEVLSWLSGEQLPALIFVFFMTGARLRSVGPYLLVVFFLLTTSSLMGLGALEQLINKGTDTWLAHLVYASNPPTVFILFSILPWLLAFYPIRYFAQRLAEAYRNKAFSEPLYLFAGLWGIALLFQAMMLSHSIGLMAYWSLLAWLIIPVAVQLMKTSLQPRIQPPTLLLLRVFRSDDTIKSLFDSVVERWRYSGNTVMIAGKDLALSTLEPDELFAFFSCHLKDRFISDEHKLLQAYQALDMQADPDGRYRVNEFFCFDHTWKIVLAKLVDKADCVLMDLRSYNADRHGCTHELKVLSNQPHLRKLVILYDRHTEKNLAEQLLLNSQIKIVWINSETHPKALKQAVLSALLSA